MRKRSPFYVFVRRPSDRVKWKTLYELPQTEHYERVDSGVKAHLIWEACEESNRKSAKHVMGGPVSRQSIQNAIMSCDEEIEILTDEQKRAVKELPIRADEDHVQLR